MSNPYSHVPALKPPKSVFDLSYEKKFDFDFGQLIPVCCEEMVPGDIFKVGNEIVIRFNPMFAPILQELNAYVHYFFVPTRLIFDGWEEFITGGEVGPDFNNDSGPTLPRLSNVGGISHDKAYGPYSLYDYFGFPLFKYTSGSHSGEYGIPGGFCDLPDPEFFFRPLFFPWYCYNLVWNEYYRDENMQNEVPLYNLEVLNRNWAKDYFTSALFKQQRGVAPALPISGTIPVLFRGPTDIPINALYGNTNGSITPDHNDLGWNDTGAEIPTSARGRLGYVDLKQGSATADVSDLRLIVQVQKWMERNQRAGVRYTEFLHAHYSVSPRDDRLQRPEYLGGSKSPIIVSEVLQTAQDADAGSSGLGTGNLYGKAITADRNYVCKYHAKEFGYLIGLLSVMPKGSYMQGVDRQWLRKSRWDFYFYEFAHLSEQDVTTEELYAFPGKENSGGIGNGWKFGYQARFNEMRANKSKVCGALRDSLDFWHLGRKFSSVPQLNSDFISCDATRDDLKRIFQVQSVPGMICNFANRITAIRPLPKYGEPGYVDHF